MLWQEAIKALAGHSTIGGDSDTVMELVRSDRCSRGRRIKIARCEKRSYGNLSKFAFFSRFFSRFFFRSLKITNEK